VFITLFFLLSTMAQAQTHSLQCPSYSGQFEAVLAIANDRADFKVLRSQEQGEFALAVGETISLVSQESAVAGWLEFAGHSELGQTVRINFLAADLQRLSMKVTLSNTGEFQSSVEVINQLDCLRK
jgi:hypothetical protein